MYEFSYIFLPHPGVKSLCWHGDSLYDWVRGGDRYSLDGEKHGSHWSIGYRFDAAATSPSGRFAAVYERFGTKGFLIETAPKRRGLREINRSFDHADVFQYPIALFALPDGREVIAHCPDHYNVLQIEDLETGERLTQRDWAESSDFYHSRLIIDPPGRYLLSAGWVWHPFDTILAYEISAVLRDPDLLNGNGVFPPRSREVSTAAFVDSETLLCASNHDAVDFSDEAEERLPPQIELIGLFGEAILGPITVEEDVGKLMPLSRSYAIGFFEHPKLIELSTGKILHRWDEIDSGNERSSIGWQAKLPPIALDHANRRFAVADKSGIHVVTVRLGD